VPRLPGNRVVEVAPRIPVQTGPFDPFPAPMEVMVADDRTESNITGARGYHLDINGDLARKVYRALKPRACVWALTIRQVRHVLSRSLDADGRRIVVAELPVPINCVDR